MQRYKCNTKEKKNIFVRRTCGRRMVDSVYKLPKRFVDLIYLYTCLKIKVLVSSERSVWPYSNTLVEHWIFAGSKGAIEANRTSLWAVKRWHCSN